MIHNVISPLNCDAVTFHLRISDGYSTPCTSASTTFNFTYFNCFYDLGLEVAGVADNTAMLGSSQLSTLCKGDYCNYNITSLESVDVRTVSRYGHTLCYLLLSLTLPPIRVISISQCVMFSHVVCADAQYIP